MPNPNDDKKTPMTPDAAKRIGDAAERTGTNTDFADRAKEAANRNQSTPKK